MIWVFWFSIGVVVYCYFGYPAGIWALAQVRSRPVRKDRTQEPPTVSVVISAWNEEDVIERRLSNLQALEYPQERIEILVGSDGSADRTNDLLAAAAAKDPRIRSVVHRERRGKMQTLNELVAAARHDVIVFADCRQTFAPDAVKELVLNLTDPEVGCVSGELVFYGEEGGATAKGVGLYWRYEKFIRRCESQVHSMLGATGAIYAIRRDLFVPGPQEVVLDDMWTPLNIIRQGYRAVFDNTAQAQDRVAATAAEEHRRKARTLFGNYQMIRLLPDMYFSARSPVAVQLVSHKFLRLVAPFFLITAAAVNIALAGEPFYRIILVGHVLFYAAALTGGLARNAKYGILKVIARACYAPYVFCLLNFSALAGLARFLKAKQNIAWEKARETGE